jgi:ATP-dependent helicase/nuclease subunit A
MRFVLTELYLTKELAPRKSHFSKETATKMPAETSWLETAKTEAISLLTRHDMHVRADTTAALLVLAEAVFQRFEKAKLAAGAYDFDDLIARARSLLRDTANAQWVLYKLDRGLTHVLVDEAQDTNPDQWAIIRAISDEFYAGAGAPQDVTRTLFVVGDRKQSIFSFQGAEASAFETVRSEVTEQIVNAGHDHPGVSLKHPIAAFPRFWIWLTQCFPQARSCGWVSIQR